MCNPTAELTVKAEVDEIELRLLDTALNRLQSRPLSALGDHSIETVEMVARMPFERIREKWHAPGVSSVRKL